MSHIAKPSQDGLKLVIVPFLSPIHVIKVFTKVNSSLNLLPRLNWAESCQRMCWCCWKRQLSQLSHFALSVHVLLKRIWFCKSLQKIIISLSKVGKSFAAIIVGNNLLFQVVAQSSYWMPATHFGWKILEKPTSTVFRQVGMVERRHWKRLKMET